MAVEKPEKPRRSPSSRLSGVSRVGLDTPNASPNQAAPHATNAAPARPSPRSSTNHADAGSTLCQLLERAAGVEDDGYYKLCPGSEGKSWYLSYRWKWGLHAGHYVMAVVTRWDLEYGLALLTEKVAQVRAGVLRPTQDKFGD